MFFITQPSAIRFHANLAIYCYNCPECNLRLTKRMRPGKLLKLFSNLFPLKKYVCKTCRQKYYVPVKTYSTKSMPRRPKYVPDVLESSTATSGNDRSKTGLIAKMFRLPLIYGS